MNVVSTQSANMTPVAGRLIVVFTLFHFREVFAFLSHPQARIAEICLLGAFVICFCAYAALRIIDSIYVKQTPVIEVSQKHSNGSIKEYSRGSVKQNFGEFDFQTQWAEFYTDLSSERSRRACSVPLDCECA